MKCDVIFYLAKKTALCQKKLGEMLTVRGYEINTVTAATSPQSLGMQLTDDLNCVNLVFIVGGLRDNDIRGISNVFSKALANSSTDIIPKRLKNEVGLFDGYILRSGKQTIICIPDTPKEIESVLNEPLLNYLDRIYFGD
ncbi:MAG: hypothetical protein MSH11_03825 [Ruminococcus sp.]|nr:hypothetical protein [Ruminococcus sp.]